MERGRKVSSVQAHRALEGRLEGRSRQSVVALSASRLDRYERRSANKPVATSRYDAAIQEGKNRALRVDQARKCKKKRGGEGKELGGTVELEMEEAFGKRKGADVGASDVIASYGVACAW